MFAFKHGTGGFRTPDAQTPDEQRSSGPISLHNVIEVRDTSAETTKTTKVILAQGKSLVLMPRSRTRAASCYLLCFRASYPPGSPGLRATTLRTNRLQRRGGFVGRQESYENASTKAPANLSAISPVVSSSGSKMVTSIPTASPERKSPRRALSGSGSPAGESPPPT